MFLANDTAGHVSVADAFRIAALLKQIGTLRDGRSLREELGHLATMVAHPAAAEYCHSVSPPCGDGVEPILYHSFAAQPLMSFNLPCR